MRVMNPSTCGWILVERRDLTVPTNSVSCSTGFASRVTISTPVAGIVNPDDYEKGKLRDFYQKFLADKKDLTGQAAMEEVLGEKLDTFEPKWRKWALALQGDNR